MSLSCGVCEIVAEFKLTSSYVLVAVVDRSHSRLRVRPRAKTGERADASGECHQVLRQLVREVRSLW